VHSQKEVWSASSILRDDSRKNKPTTGIHSERGLRCQVCHPLFVGGHPADETKPAPGL
jgi:hypothetical protein